MTEPTKPLRGFASVKHRDPDLMKQIASMGGVAAHKCGRGHEFTSQEARAAAKKRGASLGVGIQKAAE